MSQMDSRYHEYPAWSEEHRAAYAEAFAAAGGTGFPVEDDVGLSYEIDNAYELAAERYDPGGVDGDDGGEAPAERYDDGWRASVVDDESEVPW